MLAFVALTSACGREEAGAEGPADPRSGDATSGVRGVSDLLEPPGHAAAEPHPFDGCPEGACSREQPAYLFSGEFHETVVDLRVSSCTIGLDLVWARRYRSRAALPAAMTPMGNGWDHSYNIWIEVDSAMPEASSIVVWERIFWGQGIGV